MLKEQISNSLYNWLSFAGIVVGAIGLISLIWYIFEYLHLQNFRIAYSNVKKPEADLIYKNKVLEKRKWISGIFSVSLFAITIAMTILFSKNYWYKVAELIPLLIGTLGFFIDVLTNAMITNTKDAMNVSKKTVNVIRTQLKILTILSYIILGLAIASFIVILVLPLVL